MRTAEFELAVRCCRKAFDPQSAGAQAHQPLRIDWDLFYRTVAFHRVQGLVWRALAADKHEVPPEIVRAIADDAAGIAARNREALAASVQLADTLVAHGTDFLFVKGLPLAALAYGSPWLKAGVDIDLLIAGAQLNDAVEALKECGFAREANQPETAEALRKWHRFRKDSEWCKAGSTARVDLHTRLTDNLRLVPAVGLSSPRQMVEIVPGCSLPSLADDELFAHLCVHGASSAWFRLKWVTDLAAFLHPREPSEVARLYARSQELGAGRSAAQALLLADLLYGSLRALPELTQHLKSDRISRWLLDQALRQLAGKPQPIEPTAHRWGTLRIHLTQLGLLPGARFKASEIVRQARAALASRN